MITILPIGKNILRIIDGKKVYVLKPPIWRLKGNPKLRSRSIVVGIVGPRGSGKSVNGARLAILDYLLQGTTNVWSNMDIGFNLFMNGKMQAYHSNPIDKLTLTELDTVYRDGLIFFDEVNMAIADSRRAMARGTLAFDYVIQQLRKRRLNVIWTAQSENHVEARLREQTDIFIKCADLSLTNRKCGLGELSHCKCYDYAGLVNPQLPDKNFDGVFDQRVILNKPWWNSYSTWQLQGLEQEIQQEDSTNKYEATLNEIIEYVNDIGEPVQQQAIWAKWSIRDEGLKKQFRKMLNNKGILSTDYSRKFVTEEYYAENLT